MKKLFVLLCMLPLISQAGIDITGSIFDAKTNQPILYATVYINGTTKGTITDSTGFFFIKNIQAPCQLAISHIGYETTTRFISAEPEIVNFRITLKEKEIPIREIVIQDKNNREKNLAYFHKQFFGDNKWGDYAFLDNDSVLMFYTSGEEYLSGEDIKENPEYFKAEAIEPLKIQLPILGYDLTVYLENFEVKYIPEKNIYETYGYGFSYFSPMKIEKKYKRRKIIKNRLKAYYNSRLHFLQALQSRKLKENGYRVLKENQNKKLDFSYFDDANIDSAAFFTPDYMELNNMKDTAFVIAYYMHPRGFPLNLNKYPTDVQPVKSTMKILRDSCRIHSNGFVENQAIMFGPAIGNKKVGAILPGDFDPKNPFPN